MVLGGEIRQRRVTAGCVDFLLFAMLLFCAHHQMPSLGGVVGLQNRTSQLVRAINSYYLVVYQTLYASKADVTYFVSTHSAKA